MATSRTSYSLQLQNCLRGFNADIGLDFDGLSILRSTSLADLQKALGKIQEDQRRTRSMLYMKRLSPFLDAVDQYREVLQVFVDPSEFVANIWGCMRLLLKAAAVSNDAFNHLLNAYRDIGEALPRLSQHRVVFNTKPFFLSVLVNIYEDISRFHIEAIKCFQIRTWEQLFPTRWRILHPYITFLIKDLETCRSLIECNAALTEVGESQSTRESLHESFRGERRSEMNVCRASVLQWLSFANMETRHEDASKDRHPGTGKWLLQEKIFQEWSDSNYCAEPLLWLNGKPGAGKTVLASLVIGELRSHLPLSRTVFFYCRQSDGHRNGLVAVARTVLSQLAVLDDGLLLYIYEQAAKSGETVLSGANLAKTLLATALQTCSKTQKVYIVIDGLDEYSRNDRKDITGWIRFLIEHVSTEDIGSIRCLFISQDDGAARKDFDGIPSISVSSGFHQEDIQAYCNPWHDKICMKFGSFGHRNLAKIVTARAQGMFLFAKLVMTNLYEQATKQDVEEELKPGIFPEGLKQAYSRILDRVLGPTIQARKKEKAKQVLGWLACARRPLKWYEIQGAISIEVEESSVNYDREFKDTCKDLCASLVEINTDYTVVLVHTTAKQYLIDHRDVVPSEVEYELALLSLSYLSFEQFSTTHSSTDIVKMLCQGVFAFSDYAVCFWAIHVEAAISSPNHNSVEGLVELVETFETFLDTHWTDPVKPCVVSDTNLELLRPLERYPFYQKASQAIISAKNKLHSRAKQATDDEVLVLPEIIKNVRRTMEQIATSSDSTPDMIKLIQRFHGPNWFKCSRVNCQFYHQGFAMELQRKNHLDQHDRAYACTSDGCLYAIIGFVTKSELQKHISKYHGFELGDGPEFPDEESVEVLDGVPASPPPRQAGLKCNVCSKGFSRGNNLRAHMRTHMNERPYACNVCAKTFARLADCKRHENSIHNRKEYLCQGVLTTGTSWGCGQKFARVEELGQHFRSKEGRHCVKALQEEEMAELRQKWQQQPEDRRVEVKSVPFLPPKLLKAYPELADLPWDTYDLPPVAVSSSAGDESVSWCPSIET